MNEEEQFQHRAAQLRMPHGEEGIKISEWMSERNQYIIADTLSILKAEASDKILEIGMGNGFFVKDILSKHPSILYTGCDYSELMIAESGKINSEWIKNKQAKFVHANVSNLPFSENHFTKIFTINTLYFWDDESTVLNELNRVLQPNGKLIISFRPKHQAEKYPFVKYGFTLFTKEELSKLLFDHGFKAITVIENKEPDFDLNGELMKMENVIVSATKI